MTYKEYMEKLATIDTYNCYDYLSRTEEKELRSRNRLRVLSGEESYLSKETGFRATVKRDWYCGCSILTSYNTEVCMMQNGKFYKLWEGYSATTLKHINVFRRKFGLAPLSKREWVEMPYCGEGE